MPCNVAVHEPGPGVVFLERDHQIAVSRQRSDVTTGRIHKVQLNSRWVVNSGLLGEDPEIVAVKMDRVSEPDASQVLDDINGPCWISIGSL